MTKNTNSNPFAILNEDVFVKKIDKKIKKEKVKKEKFILKLTSSPDRPFVCGSWGEEDDVPLDFTQSLLLNY